MVDDVRARLLREIAETEAELLTAPEIVRPMIECRIDALMVQLLPPELRPVRPRQHRRRRA